MTTVEPLTDGQAQPIEDGLSTADFAGLKPARQGVSIAPPVPPEGAPVAAAGPAPAALSQAPLFSSDETGDLRGRWTEVQAAFVDEPRKAVEQADTLVAGAMKRLAEIFGEERAALENQWARGDDVSTEDLRLALQRYRSFFGRLLAV